MNEIRRILLKKGSGSHNFSCLIMFNLAKKLLSSIQRQTCRVIKVRSHGFFALRATAVTVRWVWIWFAMYLHCNRTLQSHRIGMELIHVRHHTQVCITHRANRTVWTVSSTTTQSNFCILKIEVAHRTEWRSPYGMNENRYHLDCYAMHKT